MVAADQNGCEELVEGQQSDDQRSATSEVRTLLRRKDELERSHKMQEKRHQRYQVSVALGLKECRNGKGV